MLAGRVYAVISQSTAWRVACLPNGTQMHIASTTSQGAGRKDTKPAFERKRKLQYLLSSQILVMFPHAGKYQTYQSDFTAAGRNE
eukprot:1157747-Pelagomonas_calceolata.AAC.7